MFVEGYDAPGLGTEDMFPSRRLAACIRRGTYHTV